MGGLNGSQRQGVGLNNGGGVDHGYGAEHNGMAVGGRTQQLCIAGWWQGVGFEHASVNTRQGSHGWAGSDIRAECHGNREVDAEE